MGPETPDLMMTWRVADTWPNTEHNYQTLLYCQGNVQQTGSVWRWRTQSSIRKALATVIVPFQKSDTFTWYFISFQYYENGVTLFSSIKQEMYFLVNKENKNFMLKLNLRSANREKETPECMSRCTNEDHSSVFCSSGIVPPHFCSVRKKPLRFHHSSICWKAYNCVYCTSALRFFCIKSRLNGNMQSTLS
jgi:hypothetical protein